MKHLAILGSTGSIGTSTLDVLRSVKGLDYTVYALAVRNNVHRLEEQIREFRPQLVAVWDEGAARLLEKKKKRLGLKNILAGAEGLTELVRNGKIDAYVFGLSGSLSVFPLLEALKRGKRVAIANKEPLVLAGNLVRKYVRKYGAEILPIDSEHSAIFQCLQGHRISEVEKIILTSTGGPFFFLPQKVFRSLTPEKALKHPKWKMGKKITIDSATMMNKALEIIEATTLFDVSVEKVEVLIHPGAIIHSMVQFQDASVIAQLGMTDMRLPIQYALSYPRRTANSYPRVDFHELGKLEFFAPDFRKFPTLSLAYWAAREEGTLPAVLNAADEVCVEAFLNRKIPFNRIFQILEKTMRNHRNQKHPTYQDVMMADAWAREETRRFCQC